MSELPRLRPYSCEESYCIVGRDENDRLPTARLTLSSVCRETCRQAAMDEQALHDEKVTEDYRVYCMKFTEQYCIPGSCASVKYVLLSLYELKM
jgi:hypothetical protein